MDLLSQHTEWILIICESLRWELLQNLTQNCYSMLLLTSTGLYRLHLCTLHRPVIRWSYFSCSWNFIKLFRLLFVMSYFKSYFISWCWYLYLPDGPISLISFYLRKKRRHHRGLSRYHYCGLGFSILYKYAENSIALIFLMVTMLDISA